MSAIPRDPQIDFDLVREAFDFTTVGLVVITPEGLFREVNRAFCEMTGYSRDELEGQSFRQFTHPEDVTRDDDQLRHVRSGGDLPMSTDKRFIRKDGSELWVRRSATVVRDAGGNVRYVVGAMVDLTEQRQKDRAIRQMNGFLTALVDNSPVAIYTTDFEGVITFWNPAAERIFGFTREQVLGKYALFVQDEKRPEAADIRRRLISGETLHELELVRRRGDGALVTLHGAGAPLRDENDRITGLLFTCIDVTAARRNAAELERHSHFMRALIDAIPSPVYFKDNQGRYALRNRAWEDLFGGGKNWSGKTVRDMFESDIAAVHEEHDRVLLDRPSSTTYEMLMPLPDGEKRQMLYNKVSFVDQKGDVAGLIGVITDVTRYKETERALEASEARFRVLTESSIDLISVIDSDGTMQYQSAALRHLLGFDPADSVGKNVFDLVHRDDVEHVRAAFRRITDSRALTEPVEFRLQHRDGGLAQPSSRSAPTACPIRTFAASCGIRCDVTDRKENQQRFQHLAYHDNLTGLPNRGLLQDRLARSVARAERSGRKVAVLFIDLDNFKNINDTLGHDVGDELLRQVSRRLSECVRLEDTIARQGGDEFIVLLDNLEEGRNASVVAQKILNSLRLPLLLGGTEQHVSGSVGIALYPEDGRDAQTLMKNADTAMFHGKGLGKNTYQYFTAQMNIAVKRRMTLESALRRAVVQRDFVLHYQPQIDLVTGEIIACEALVRWKTEDSGTVMPGDFIPLAEETGLINEIGEWVLREGCRQAKEWQDKGLSAQRRMAINLSARQFSDKGFLDMVNRILSDTGLPATCLELEITESQVMRQTDGMIQLLHKLSEMGVQLAIDDFGTGYSSLSYLKRLPIQKLKIDQSFIRDITVDPNDTAIVVAIINMARSLDLGTIAEGVETAGQLALLRSKGCNVGQGFYFSAPVTAQEIYPLLRQNRVAVAEAR